jgi:hypothetical protein
VDRTEVLTLAAAPEAVMAVVGDLEAYPRWLDLVRRVTDAEPEADGTPAWFVELRGKVGPLARSKRLRMVRVARDERTARFERREADGRPHSEWVLDVEVVPKGEGSELAMRLRYGGSLWGPLLDRLLADAVQRGRTTLPQVVSEG